MNLGHNVNFNILGNAFSKLANSASKKWNPSSVYEGKFYWKTFKVSCKCWNSWSCCFQKLCLVQYRLCCSSRSVVRPAGLLFNPRALHMETGGCSSSWFTQIVDCHNRWEYSGHSTLILCEERNFLRRNFNVWLYLST